MQTPARLRVGLAAKLAIFLVASTAAFSALFGYFNVRDQRKYSEGLVLQEADRISDIILRSTQYQMMHNDREALYNVISDIASEPGIRKIRIFNKEGRISSSTDPREVNTAVDKRAEQCYVCHLQSAPLTKLARPDRSRIFTDAQGHRLLGVIRPIENKPACSEASCHAHAAAKRVLGVIDVDLSLASVDAKGKAHQASLIWATVVAIVMVSALSVLFIVLVIYRPVKRLIDGTHRVADGDLDYRLEVGSNDELGDLARSFNKMTTEVSTAYSEIEERVRRKTAELEKAHKSLVRTEKLASVGKLAATVAHEVNNPLFGILTYARLSLKTLDRNEANAELVEHLEIIERESRRCGDIMRNLLTYARQAPSIRSGNDVNELVRRAVVLVRHKLEMLGVELEEHLTADLPPVECDAGQIQQVALVLLVNASEAMSKGGRLTVSVEPCESGNEVKIRVKDTGSGIPPEVLPNIFDPFFTTKDDQQRTGLGLAVAKSIIEQHGGEISVESAVGVGTEFSVTLPVAEPSGFVAGSVGQAGASPGR